MDYRHEQSFLRRSRLLGLLAGALVLAAVAAALRAAPPGKPLTIAAALVALALAASLCYTPDYLHFTVNPEKRPRWQLKVRRRLLAIALIAGVLLALVETPFRTMWSNGVPLAIAVIWLAFYLAAQDRVPARWFAAYFWTTDFLLLTALLMLGRFDLVPAAALLAAAAHLSIVIVDKRPLGWAATVIVLSCALVLVAAQRRGADSRSTLAAVALVAVSALATGLLVARVQRHHASNIAAAIPPPTTTWTA